MNNTTSPQSGSIAVNNGSGTCDHLDSDRKIRHTSRTFSLMNVLLLTLFTLIILIPVWNIVISSFASNDALNKGNFIFWPSSLSLDNYKAIFQDSTLWNALWISVAKTVAGVITHVLVCAVFAYPLSKRYLKGRKFYNGLGIITMFFSGGMIPTYLLIKSLGLLDSFWVYILPMLFSYYDIVILMNFFRSVPQSLEESARIDGASEWKTFASIVVPLSKPALATIALFNGVAQWNDFMTTKLYINKESLYPLQMKLYNIIVQSQSIANVPGQVAITTTTTGLRFATIMVTVVPILIAYPIVQRFFVSGTMLGAVKE